MDFLVGILTGAAKEIYEIWKTSGEEQRAQIEADCKADGADAEAIAAKYRDIHADRTAETRRIIDGEP